MPRTLPKAELEKFRYWHMFLKHSKPYNELCNFINTKKEKAPFEDKRIQSWCPTSTKLMKPYRNWIYENVTKEEHAQKFNDSLTYRDVLLTGIYPLFQDINEPFSNVQRRVELFYELYDFETIKDAKEGMKNLLSFSFAANASPQDEPVRHLSDIQIDFEDYIEGIFGPTVVNMDNFIQINTRAPRELIEAQFKQYLDSIYDQQRKAEIALLAPFFTTGNMNFQRWDDNLEALSALEAASGDEKQAFESMPDSIQWRTFTKRIERAKKLIKDAESGIFPQKTA